MKRVSILNNIEKRGVIAVIRGDSAKKAFDTSKAIVAGGVKVLEVTFTINGAEKVITQLKDEYKNQGIMIGAGTVLDSMTARIAIMAGATFIVSPTFNRGTAKLCNLYQVPYIPGCGTVGEIQDALTYGSDIVKLFPGDVLKPAFIRSVKGPLPHVNLMPSGGVHLGNIGEWIAAGVVAVSVGSHLTSPVKTASAVDYEKVSKLAQEYQLAYESAKRGDQQ